MTLYVKKTAHVPDACLIEDLIINLITLMYLHTKITEYQINSYLNVQYAKQKDKAWSPHVSGLLKKGKLADDDVITWSSHNSRKVGA